MLKQLVIGLLALASAVCVYLAAEPAWLRYWVKEQLAGLESADRSEFSRAYASLAYDPDGRISLLLCDALDRRPSRELRYQIIRVLHTRLGIQYAPEDTRLPSNEHMRRLVKERYARSALAPAEKP